MTSLCFLPERIGNSLGKSSPWNIFLRSFSRSLYFPACADKWQLTNNTVVPKILKPMATAPLVRNADAALVPKESDSGTEDLMDGFHKLIQ